MLIDDSYSMVTFKVPGHQGMYVGQIGWEIFFSNILKTLETIEI